MRKFTNMSEEYIRQLQQQVAVLELALKNLYESADSLLMHKTGNCLDYDMHGFIEEAEKELSELKSKK